MEIVEAGSLPEHPASDAADLTLALSEESGSVRVTTTTERFVAEPWGSVPHIEQGFFATEEAAFLGDTNLLLILTAVVALLLASVAALWLSRSFVRPVFALTEAAERLANGDLSQRVTVERPDELGRLALSFNAMAESLED
jgi:methyl-accepting chemotaxis protein